MLSLWGLPYPIDSMCQFSWVADVCTNDHILHERYAELGHAKETMLPVSYPYYDQMEELDRLIHLCKASNGEVFLAGEDLKLIGDFLESNPYR